MSVAVRKLPGVESVEVSLQRAVADIRLRPGNQVSLAQVRQLIKSNGFLSKEATVIVLGTLAVKDGKTTVAVPGVSAPLIVSDRSSSSARESMKTLLASSPGATVELAGVVENTGGSDVISASAAKRAQ